MYVSLFRSLDSRMYFSKINEQFNGEDPWVKPRWSGFCDCSMFGDSRLNGYPPVVWSLFLLNTSVNTPCFIIAEIVPLLNILFINFTRTGISDSKAKRRCSAVTPNISAAFPVLRNFSASLVLCSVYLFGAHFDLYQSLKID